MRFVACVVLAAAAALAVRHDHGREQARADSVAELVRSAGADGRVTPRAVRDALEDAGPAGLALGFRALDDPVPDVRAGAVAYLGLRRSRRAVPHLIRLLRDPEPLVRQAAASALGAIGDPRAIPFLTRTMGSDGPDVADAALRAARNIRAAEQHRQR